MVPDLEKETLDEEIVAVMKSYLPDELVTLILECFETEPEQPSYLLSVAIFGYFRGLLISAEKEQEHIKQLDFLEKESEKTVALVSINPAGGVSRILGNRALVGPEPTMMVPLSQGISYKDVFHDKIAIFIEEALNSSGEILELSQRTHTIQIDGFSVHVQLMPTFFDEAEQQVAFSVVIIKDHSQDLRDEFTKRLEAAVEALRLFAIEFFHTDKSRLNSIQLDLQLLKQVLEADYPQGLPEKAEKLILKIDGTVTKIFNNMKQFMNMTAVEILSRESTEFDDQALLESVREMMQSFGEDNPTVKFQLQDTFARNGRFFLVGNFDLLKAAIGNLFRNAAHYAGRGGTVTVRLDKPPGVDYLFILIQDSGPGVSEEDGPNLFRYGFHRTQGGTGMGLFLVKQIVERMEGTIEFENNKAGTLFQITLPTQPRT